ncbi:MAG: transposase [Myxococcota bacterium]
MHAAVASIRVLYRFCQVLQHTARERSTDVLAWCVMPDHVHLLVVDVDVLALVRLLKGRIVPIARQLEPTRRLWQRSFHDHALRKQEKAEHVARYILENPDRAGLVDNGVYPWRGELTQIKCYRRSV